MISLVYNLCNLISSISFASHVESYALNKYLYFKSTIHDRPNILILSYFGISLDFVLIVWNILTIDDDTQIYI